jgi:hypothetical protein
VAPGSESRRSETGPQARRIGNRTMTLIDGTWVDRSFDASESLPRVTVEAFSDDYFRWVTEQPELARVFALGEKVLVVVTVDGKRSVLELVPASPAPDPSGR